jgi:predicted MFS family arabinose efflux permease
MDRSSPKPERWPSGPPFPEGAYKASSIAGSALGAVLLSDGLTRRIALSAALGCGAMGSLLVVHDGNWSLFAASILVGLGSVTTPAIVTFLIRSRTSDATYPFFFTVGTASLGFGQLSGLAIGGLVADWFGLSAIGWLAAAIYGGGMLAAAADGFFGLRQPVTTTNTNAKEDRHALSAS